MTDTISVVQNIDEESIDIPPGGSVELVVVQVPQSCDLITVEGIGGDQIELTPSVGSIEISITDTNEPSVIEINESVELSTITIVQGEAQNDLDRMINPAHPSSNREFEYDQDGNISTILVFDGATQLFEREMNYDQSGRIESVVTDDLIGNTQLTKNISYGAGGEITGVSREVVSI